MGAVSLKWENIFHPLATLLLVSLGIVVIVGCRPTVTFSESPAAIATPEPVENQVTPQATPTPIRTPPAFNPPDTFITPPPRLGPPPNLADSSPAFGPSTRGIIITIAGKKIKIPDDAYIDSFIKLVDPLPGLPTYDTPTVGIKRGKSRIGISVPKGVIITETVSPDEVGTFDWLLKELPPQTTGLRTKGGTIIIAGKTVKLPEDAYLMKTIDYIKPSDPQADPFPGAKLPIYAIVIDRKLSAIYISADGKVVKETLPKGAAGFFDSIKDALK